MWTLAWVTEREPDAAADLTRLPPATGMVPEPAVPRAIGGRAWRMLWLAGAVAFLGTGVWQQVAAEIRQDRADIVTVVVDDYVEDYAKVRLMLPGGDTADVAVDSVWDYPRHSEIKVYADGAGMVQPVAEPYDATGWLTPASALLLLGVAQHRRRRRREGVWSRFFDAPQPTMRAWFSPGTGLIYPADAVLEGPPLARVRSMQWASRAGSGFDVAPVFPGPARGTVCGDLVVGGPVAFTADDLPIVVTGYFGKARHTTANGFAGEREAPGPGEDDEEPAERRQDAGIPHLAPGPDEVHDVRVESAAAYTVAVLGTALLTAQSLRIAGPATTGGVLAVAVPVAAIALLLVWRFQIWPFLRFNQGGLVVAGRRGVVRLRWSQVRQVRARWGVVKVDVVDGRILSANSGAGGFASIAAADAIADRMNTARRLSRQSLEPPQPLHRANGTTVLVSTFVAVVTLAVLFWPLES